MKTARTTSFLLALVVASSIALPWNLFGQTGGPPLEVQRDVTGVKLTWDADDGMDFVLEASDDFHSWEGVTQIVVKEGDRHRVFVPASEAKNFYRLTNDGMRVQPAYMGSQSCATCHRGIYDTFLKTGHPYKLVEVTGEPPKYFGEDQTNVTELPPGYVWDDISWIIGGAYYKARFVDQDGYIITGDTVQYNLETQRWVGYHADELPGTKPYNCGACHTTGWVPTSMGSVSQDGMPGMWGSFAAGGIQCEACHGPGSRHVKTLSANEILVDRSSALCGQCHIRGSSDTIPASGGFIRHHEQYNEMLSGPHKNLSCNDCHNPHITVKRDVAGGIIKDCTDCHSPDQYANDFHSNFAHCVDCHMPKATRTAEASNKYTGDIQTHIFAISSDPNAPMFNEAGNLAVGGYVTLDYACYSCHKDPDGVGGDRSTKTMEELAARASGFHSRN